MFFAFTYVLLGLALARYLVLERRTRRAWRRVPKKKRRAKTPYRGETATDAGELHTHAPALVRAVALGSLVFGVLYPIESFFMIWRRATGDNGGTKVSGHARSAAHAILGREKGAAEIARSASEVQTRTHVLLGMLLLVATPWLVSQPAILAALVAFIVIGLVNARMLLRTANTYEEALGHDLEDDAAPNATAANDDDARDVPPWLSHALARRAESRGPRMRIEAPIDARKPRIEVASEITKAPIAIATELENKMDRELGEESEEISPALKKREIE